MPSLLRDRPASTPQMLAAFGDAALLKGALAFEAALARASAIEGLIPQAAAVEARPKPVKSASSGSSLRSSAGLA